MRRRQLSLFKKANFGRVPIGADWNPTLPEILKQLEVFSSAMMGSSFGAYPHFKTLKSELVWRTTFFTRAEAERDIARYIDGFYDPVRRHSALDYLSPRTV